MKEAKKNLMTMGAYAETQAAIHKKNRKLSYYTLRGLIARGLVPYKTIGGIKFIDYNAIPALKDFLDKNKENQK